MLKKIGLGFTCLGIVLCHGISAANMQLMERSMSATYTLEPHEPLELFNFTFWTIEAVCEISTIDEVDEIQASLLNRTGIVNGKNLTKGDIFKFNVRSGDTLRICAESRAKVELINFGQQALVAKCST